MKKIYHYSLLIFLLSFSLIIKAQLYTGPIAKPFSGYGSDGAFSITSQTLTNANYPAESIRIYYPTSTSSVIPTLFYSHGYGGENPLHVIGLLNFFAKKGYAVVFVPYPTIAASINDRYVTLLEGFRAAARTFTTIIDTTRVGFLGHSFGGGATIANSFKCFTENNWGQNGRLICPSGQWYSFNITQTELQSFPTDTKMLTFVYDKDSVNDHRMAVDIYHHINIPVAEKDFIKVLPSVVSGYTYTAEHDMPTTYASYDAMDHYAYYRLIEALCDYTFNGNLTGKNTALGNGSALQITMPTGMTNLQQTDTPFPAYAESIYGFPCSSATNPRQSFCNTSVSIKKVNELEQIKISSINNFTSYKITSEGAKFALDITDITGRKILCKDQTEITHTIDLENYPSGIYIAILKIESSSMAVKLFKP